MLLFLTCVGLGLGVTFWFAIQCMNAWADFVGGMFTNPIGTAKAVWN